MPVALTTEELVLLSPASLLCGWGVAGMEAVEWRFSSFFIFHCLVVKTLPHTPELAGILQKSVLLLCYKGQTWPSNPECVLIV